MGARSLRATLHYEPGLWIETDLTMFLSIVSNLMDNALNYPPEGGEISISGAAVGNTVRIRFENTSDLTPEDLDRMFDPFWRKNGARAGAGHSGLGLALVRVMCEALGAKVWAELGDDQRFAITVSLPGLVHGPDRFTDAVTDVGQVRSLTPTT